MRTASCAGQYGSLVSISASACLTSARMSLSALVIAAKSVWDPVLRSMFSGEGGNPAQKAGLALKLHKRCHRAGAENPAEALGVGRGRIPRSSRQKGCRCPMATSIARSAAASPRADASEHLTHDDRVALLRFMVLMRALEERAGSLYR